EFRPLFTSTQDAPRRVEIRISPGPQVGQRAGHDNVGLDAVAFDSSPFRSQVVLPAQLKLATTGQAVEPACEYGTGRLPANNRGPPVILKDCRENLRRARRGAIDQNDDLALEISRAELP